jgi:hypothetical protein
VTVPGGDACWNWSGSNNGNGYGIVRGRGKKKVFAHRASYRCFVGPIPEGLHVLHSCDNPRCVNPGHLHLGTHADNMREAAERELMCRGEDRPNAKLDWASIASIRIRRARGEFQRELAKEFGVDRSLISRVCSGQRWRPLPAQGATV